MADFAVFGEAVSRGLRNPTDKFLGIYRENRKAANESALEESHAGTAIRELVASKQWKGTAAELKAARTERRQGDLGFGSLAENTSRNVGRAPSSGSIVAPARHIRRIRGPDEQVAVNYDPPGREPGHPNDTFVTTVTERCNS